jgi:hypothetical protein
MSLARRLFHPPDRRRPVFVFPNVALASSLHCWLALDMEDWQEPEPEGAPPTRVLDRETITMDTVVLPIL